MAKFELNIYGKNDEIVNQYATDILPWGLMGECLKLRDELKEADPVEMLDDVAGLVKALFVGMTDEEIQHADTFDILAVFAQMERVATKIKGKSGGSPKN